MNDEVAQLVPTLNDREVAARLRQSLERSLGVVLDIMNEAEGFGLRASFQIARDQFGRNRIADIAIMRLL